jgi:hypothetical protein
MGVSFKEWELTKLEASSWGMRVFDIMSLACFLRSLVLVYLKNFVEMVRVFVTVRHV